MKLANRVAIVTGGAGGIGAGIARCLAKEGARVAVVDLDGRAAGRLAADLGGRSIGVQGDAAEERQAAEFVESIARRLGGVDILVNSAGAGRSDPPDLELDRSRGTPLETMPQAEWDETLAQNLRTAYVTSRAAVRFMKTRRRGAIINVASIAGSSARPVLPAYAAARAGVMSLTRTMALEFAAHQIRVNAICPGLLWTRARETPVARVQEQDPDTTVVEPRDLFLRNVALQVPLGREQTPEDIGQLATFLCSDDGKNITGQSIAVDGGITLRGTP